MFKTHLVTAMRFARDVMFVALLIYCGSYRVLSFLGRFDEDCPLWAFQGARMCYHEFEPGGSKYAKERQLFAYYYPLIRADRLRGHYHILDEDLPYTGG